MINLVSGLLNLKVMAPRDDNVIESFCHRETTRKSIKLF